MRVALLLLGGVAWVVGSSCSEESCYAAARDAGVRYVNPLMLSVGRGCVHDTRDAMVYLSPYACTRGWMGIECLECSTAADAAA